MLACRDTQEHVIRIGVSFAPANEILELIRPALLEEGIELDIRQFTHFSLANMALSMQELDANFIQHQHFLHQFNTASNSDLRFITGVYHAKLSLYSGIFENISDISADTTVLMINDDMNFARSLHLLHQAELIVLDQINPFVTVDNIISNPLNLVFRRVDPLTMALTFQEQGSILAIMYPTFTRSVDPQNFLVDQIIFSEILNDFTKEYAIGLAANSSNYNSHNIKRLAYHLSSSIVAEWLKSYYYWASIPVLGN